MYRLKQFPKRFVKNVFNTFHAHKDLKRHCTAVLLDDSLKGTSEAFPIFLGGIKMYIH